MASAVHQLPRIRARRAVFDAPSQDVLLRLRLADYRVNRSDPSLPYTPRLQPHSRGLCRGLHTAALPAQADGEQLASSRPELTLEGECTLRARPDSFVVLNGCNRQAPRPPLTPSPKCASRGIATHATRRESTIMVANMDDRKVMQ